MNSKYVVYNAVIAAIYVALTVINPIGTMAIQIRVSEMISVLPFFNRKFIPGVLIGVGIANMFSGLGILDVIVGVGIGAVAYTISYFVKNVWINVVIFSLLCGVFVGWMLLAVAELPFWISFFSITISTLITTSIGALIFKSIGKRITEI
ncbi:MAG TPA: QueT transporter family protein [Aliicoccus persicus]|uniref:QueT transporter family protein n=1 Tax=Aliicoccus persicus TaxID=930138 RepID=A0A921DY04_9STAP|nr:QueT transporter family protein [Aliicoccus persicus]